MLDPNVYCYSTHQKVGSHAQKRRSIEPYIDLLVVYSSASFFLRKQELILIKRHRYSILGSIHSGVSYSQVRCKHEIEAYLASSWATEFASLLT